jgi:hypothetical protein
MLRQTAVANSHNQKAYAQRRSGATRKNLLQLINCSKDCWGSQNSNG